MLKAGWRSNGGMETSALVQSVDVRLATPPFQVLAVRILTKPSTNVKFSII